jgi:two-component system, LuxR family, sensor kinase FixL
MSQTSATLPSERRTSLFEDFLGYSEIHRVRVLSVAAGLVLLVVFADWKIQPNVSLGALYSVPILLASGALRRWQIVGLSAVCAVLREAFGPFTGEPGMAARLLIVAGGFSGAGLLVFEISHSRRLAVRHLRLREEAEQQLRVLIETSPLAIVTLDSAGTVLVANQSANRLLGFFDGDALQGRGIAPYLPVLARPLRAEDAGRSLRTTVECRGRRRDGEVFLAQVWFSTYRIGEESRLAAVIWDASENLRDREDAGLESMMSTSRVLIGALSHEVRNLAAAAASAYGSLEGRVALAGNTEFQALGALVRGLEQVATSGLRLAADRKSACVDLETVLDEARIIIEPSLREFGVSVRWEAGPDLPLVRADHHSLLQVFLNLARNSERAMRESARKEFSVHAAEEGGAVLVRFCDTGCGVDATEHLFQPFQPGAEQSGLGLYVSRAIVRSFDGDLRYVPQAGGSCFVVELRPASEDREGGR